MVKSQDRFAIVLGTSLVAITFLLVLDIQSGLNLCGAPIYQTDSSESAEQHVENDKSINSDEDGIEQTEQIDIFAALKRHIGYQWVVTNFKSNSIQTSTAFHSLSDIFSLRKLGQLREFIGARSSSHDIRGMFDMTKDRFTDLEEALDYIKMTDASGERGRRQYPTISQILSITVKCVSIADWISVLKSWWKYANLFDFQWKLHNFGQIQLRNQTKRIVCGGFKNNWCPNSRNGDSQNPPCW